MSTKFEASIIRIRKSDKTVVGVGFLVDEHSFITCAHVIARALNLDNTPSSRPNETIYVDFPLVDPDHITLASVIFWQPPKVSGHGDLAGLRIVGEIPSAAQPLDLILVADLWGHHFKTFGFPVGQNNGIYSSGIIQGKQASGWIQIEDVKETGFRVEPGFSGAPVWDEQLSGAVGMIIAAEKREKAKAAFMIPIDSLIEIWPMLKRRTYVVDLPSSSIIDPTSKTTIINPLFLKIFVFALSDVADERGLALKVLERLPYDPLLRDKITIGVITWDKTNTDTPELISITPDEATKRGLEKPWECDIVAIILWAQVGPSLPSYAASTGNDFSLLDWIYEETIRYSRNHNKPLIMLYRRKNSVLLNPEDQKFESMLNQYKQAKNFIERSSQSDIPIINEYSTPSDFQKQFEYNLREFISQRFRGFKNVVPIVKIPLISSAPVWDKPPFPGLRPLGPDDASIFFGRERETDELISLIADSSNCFTAIIGASGSGKSSLVGAGLIPRLKDNAIMGSKDWLILAFSPAEVSDNPFVALAVKLINCLGEHNLKARGIVSKLCEKPEFINDICNLILKNRPTWAKILFSIDQFEEIFTLVSSEYLSPFIEMLVHLSNSGNTRIIVTLRSEFYSRCIELPKLAYLLRKKSYPLPSPGRDSLYEMITRPAICAGLQFEVNLAKIILNHTGTDPGALALMAYALEELYNICKEKNYLTSEAYESFGGVRGAIGTRAEEAYSSLNATAKTAMFRMFDYLVGIDKSGIAARKRVQTKIIIDSESTAELIEALTIARLLTKGSSEDGEPVVELAHEALLQNWPRLASWIDRKRKLLKREERLSDHSAEMAMRRLMAAEIQSSGPVFLPKWGKNDGHYCWVIISSSVNEKIFRKIDWFSDNTPGVRTKRILPTSKELKKMIFRLRGIDPRELDQIVKNQTILIGEYWPNDTHEDFRGVTFVYNGPSKWKQDLVPSSRKVFYLTIKEGLLWLELLTDKKAPI